RSCDGAEQLRRGANKQPLLVRSQLDHPQVVVEVSKRGEDLAADAKVRMAHVSPLVRFGQIQSQTPELVGGHRLKSYSSPLRRSSADRSQPPAAQARTRRVTVRNHGARGRRSQESSAG